VEPYKTCKLFGAVRVILGISDAIALIHSPIGCAYNLRYLLTARGAKVRRIFTTNMGEREVIFGGEAKLKKAIKDIDERISPNLIAVLTACASSIIGEDVDLIVRKMRDNVNAELIAIHSGGFEGDQIDGYREALKKVLELVEDNEKEDRCVNLLAVYRYGLDLKETLGILSEMGINVNSILTAKTKLYEIKRASKAMLNVVMCEASGLDAARFMEKRFDQPYIVPPLPIGISCTTEFFESISEFFRINPSNLKEKERTAKEKIKEFRKKLEGKRVCIISGASRAVPLLRFVDELGMIPVLVSIDRLGEETLKRLNKASKELGLSPIILKEPEYSEVLNAVRDLKPDLIIGGMYEKSFSLELGVPICDVMHSDQLTMCYKGAVNLAEKIARVIPSGK